MDWRDLADKARRQGWAIKKTGTGHLKWFSPDGKTIVVSSATPSDRRALRNHRSLLRRGGLAV